MLVLVTLILGLITLFFAFWLISLFLDISAVVDLDFNSSTILAVDFGNPIGSQDFSTPVTVSVFDMMNGSLDFFRDAGITGNFRSVSIWFFLVVVVFSFILRETTYSSAVYATGGNGEAARAQGIAVDRVRVINFVTCGALAAFAATLEFARQTSAAGDRGTGWELEAIAAAVIGGALLSGGYGTIIGTFIGVLLAGMLRTGLVQLGVPSAGFRGYIGVILVAAVILNNVVRTGQAPAWLLRVGQFLGGGGTSPPGSQSDGSAR
jgi:simple sugar transport system permease protein